MEDENDLNGSNGACACAIGRKRIRIIFCCINHQESQPTHEKDANRWWRIELKIEDGSGSVGRALDWGSKCC